MRPRIGSLCSGYGGLDLAVEHYFGADTAWFCEYDAAPSRILAHHWPDVPNHGDVNGTDWSAVEPIDILTAGYPCQPFSHAGKRKGADDERHLWPGVARAIGALRPRIVVLENVRGHVSLGLADVLADLSGLGYDARWGVVRAADAGAAHGRARIFIVAHDTHDLGRRGDGSDGSEACRIAGIGADQPVRSGPTTTDAGIGQQSRPAVNDDGLRITSERGSEPATDASGERYGRGQDRRSVGRVDGEDAGQARQRERSRGVVEHRGGEVTADADCDGRDEGRAESAWILGGSDAAISGTPPLADAEVNEQREQAEPGPLRNEPRDGAGIDWGVYTAAITRWAGIIGRDAPAPTEPGRNGNPRLSPAFVEWLMGLPVGHVTAPAIGLTRNQQLKALGNGVVPQQAVLALGVLV